MSRFPGCSKSPGQGFKTHRCGRLGHGMRRRFAPVRATRKLTLTAIKRTGLGSHPGSPRSARQIACARVVEELGTERQDSPWWGLGSFAAAAASHRWPNGEAKPNRDKADRFGFADTPAIGESERPQMARDDNTTPLKLRLRRASHINIYYVSFIIHVDLHTHDHIRFQKSGQVWVRTPGFQYLRKTA